MTWFTIIPKPDAPEYSIHQYCWQYFPDVRDGDDRPFLYRVDGDRILMLSRLEPATESVNIADRIVAGNVYQFDLLANPARGKTVTINGVKKRMPRQAYKTNSELHAWIRRRFEDGGADIKFVQAFMRPPRRFRKPGGHEISVHDVVFRGALLVKDRAQFLNKLLSGIGGRGTWGCGLLVMPEVMLCN